MEAAGLGATGLALSILAHLQKQVASVRTRWKEFRAGKERFDAVQGILTQLIGVNDKIEETRKADPDAIPKEIVGMVDATLQDAKTALEKSLQTLEEHCFVPFEERTASQGRRRQESYFKEFKQLFKRVARANALAEHLGKVEQESAMVQNALQHLETRLLAVVSNFAKTEKIIQSSREETSKKWASFKSECLHLKHLDQRSTRLRCPRQCAWTLAPRT